MNVYQITHLSENDPRISLSRDSFRLLAHYSVKRALILFISENSLNYRLSLVTIDLKWEEGKRVQKEYSNPRRYSFFLGPETKTHTPETYLIKKGRVKDFDDLKKRFSLEIVNKDFYTRIAILFTKLAGGERKTGRTQLDEKGSLCLPSTTDDKIKKEFSVRLIGRLVFCWFLKKKCSDKDMPLLPEELLSSKAVIRKSDFYHNILEPLFFEILNTQIKERKKEYQIPPWSQIPFLNGGLFANEYNDYYEIDQLGISKYINTLKVPDSWIKELFEIFEIYNFTIDENTSVDVELSIEPEMLGRIFENLLAEINPETGNTARKSTGSYYTPRPIVEYMVDESLKQYLLTKTNLDENKISSLLAYEEEEAGLSDSEKDTVLDALDVIKIIDPACGSGAFPMGILQKMLLILQKIDPESKKWLNKKVSQIENTIIREEFQKKIEAENWNYVHKLGIIQDSIYGVDIQPIAVDISKLRFFLSLIVDEKVDDLKENRGIDSLPNLEFKFVCANSLIGLPNTLVGSYKKELEPQPKLFEAVDNITELKKLREEYLRCVGNEKKLIEKKFQELQNEMFLNSLNWGGGDSQTVKLSQWNPFSGESCAWFDPEWMFGVRDGFDVVIANPPYNAKMTRDEREFFKHKYASVKMGRQDTAAIFVELAKNIGNKSMQFAYILPYRLFSRKRNHGQFQIYTLENFSIKNIIYLGANIGFSTNDEFMILIMSSILDKGNKIKIAFDSTINGVQNRRITYNEIEQVKFIEREEVNINLLKFNQELLFKIQKDTVPLISICDVRDGIVPYIREKMLNDKKIDHRYVNFAGIAGRYRLEKYYFYCDKLYLCYDINEAKKYIKDPSELRKVQLRDKEIFLNRKIITAQNSAALKGTIDENKIFVSNSLHSTFIRKEVEDTFDLEYILALYNSKVLNYYHDSLRLKGKDLHPQILIKDLKTLPIKRINNKAQKSFTFIVRKILSITKFFNYLDNSEMRSKVKEYESQIDQMVYKLYDLTNDEIKIIENFHKKA